MELEPSADEAASTIAAAMAEPARARMLYGLLDGRARTSTELAMIAEVSPSTASAHLRRLKTQGLVDVAVRGKHRYYRLDSAEVARALESLSVLAGRSHHDVIPHAPHSLRKARTCYDHMAGELGVMLHDRLMVSGWLAPCAPAIDNSYDLTPTGVTALQALGIDVNQARASRRRFSFACLDWSERRFHIGGVLGAALLNLALGRRWVTRDRAGRALQVTALGRRELLARFGLRA